MLNRRSFFRALAVGAVALFVTALPALADELAGTVKSVDIDAKKFVVTPKDSGDGVEVTVNDTTAVENAKGKTLKKFRINRLSVGGTVNVTHEKGVASKIILSKGAYKKKDA